MNLTVVGRLVDSYPDCRNIAIAQNASEPEVLSANFVAL